MYMFDQRARMVLYRANAFHATEPQFSKKESERTLTSHRLLTVSGNIFGPWFIRNADCPRPQSISVYHTVMNKTQLHEG